CVAGLGGVRAVVEADGEDLAGPRHRGSERRPLGRRGDLDARGIEFVGPGAELLPLLEDLVRVARETAGTCPLDVDIALGQPDDQPPLHVRQLHARPPSSYVTDATSEAP